MQPKEPSRTAWGAARHRAVHQLMEGGAVFKDRFAVPILGGEISESHADPLSREDDNSPGTRALSELGYASVENLSGFDLAERFPGPEFAAAARAAGKGRSGAHVLYAST